MQKLQIILKNCRYRNQYNHCHQEKIKAAQLHLNRVHSIDTLKIFTYI